MDERNGVPAPSASGDDAEACHGRLCSVRFDREAFDLAGWDELRSVDPSIVTVGSHTATHPVLPSLSPAQIEAELRDSRRMIEAKLARPADFSLIPMAMLMSAR